jgi:hypothetical protein
MDGRADDVRLEKFYVVRNADQIKHDICNAKLFCFQQLDAD